MDAHLRGYNIVDNYFLQQENNRRIRPRDNIVWRNLRRNGKTLAEIEQDYNVSAISHYKRSAALQRIIFIAGAQEAPKGSSKKKPAVTVDENTRFYIPEEMLFRAENSTKKKNTDCFR